LRKPIIGIAGRSARAPSGHTAAPAFYALYDKICREDILCHAYELARANAGAPGVDGVSFEQIEERGLEAWLTGLREELVSKTYRPDARPGPLPTIKLGQSLATDANKQTIAAPMRRYYHILLPICERICGSGSSLAKLHNLINTRWRMLHPPNQTLPVSLYQCIGCHWRAGSIARNHGRSHAARRRGRVFFRVR
jgi:hypothetical protein